jgi:hypothetical protein
MQPRHIPGMDNPDDRKKALLREFCELDRRGLIEHDRSEVNETGLVKVRIKPHLVKNDNDRFTS